jgi:hypothetical protein
LKDSLLVATIVLTLQLNDDFAAACNINHISTSEVRIYLQFSERKKKRQLEKELKNSNILNKATVVIVISYKLNTLMSNSIMKILSTVLEFLNADRETWRL